MMTRPNKELSPSKTPTKGLDPFLLFPFFLTHSKSSKQHHRVMSIQPNTTLLINTLLMMLNHVLHLILKLVCIIIPLSKSYYQFTPSLMNNDDRSKQMVAWRRRRSCSVVLGWSRWISSSISITCHKVGRESCIVMYKAFLLIQNQRE